MGPFGPIRTDGVFVVGITSLKKDIRQSVNDVTSGYPARLAREPALQQNFLAALQTIYSPYD